MPKVFRPPLSLSGSRRPRFLGAPATDRTADAGKVKRMAQMIKKSALPRARVPRLPTPRAVARRPVAHTGPQLIASTSGRRRPRG